VPAIQVETELEFENKKKKPSVLFCEHFRLFRERKKEKKENNNLV
jgi:hypothetical protein